MQRVRKSQRKAQRMLVGYEDNPAYCKTCIHYRCGIVKEGTRYQMRCAQHDFGVNPHALCDDWQDASGDTLEIKKPL